MIGRLSLLIGVTIAFGAPAPAQSTTGELAQTGWRAIENSDGDRAAQAFREALTYHPNDAVLQFGAGVAAHLQGRDHDAVLSLSRALKLEPRLTQAALLLGEIAYREGDLDLAIKTYENALSRAPDNLSLRDRLETWRGEAAVHQGFEQINDDRFAIMFEGRVEQKLAARATSVLGAAFWRIGKALGAYPSDPITVILYTERQFRDITGAPEWAGGGFDGRIRMPVQGASQNLEQFDRVLTHELTHAMLKSLAPRNVPAWLNEGLAMYFEPGDPALAERRLKAARLFVPLSLLERGFGRLNNLQAAVAYEESAMAAGAMVRRVGTGGVGLLLQDLAGGQTIDRAVQRFGFTVSEFETDLARRIRPATRSAGTR
jgi:tetratricopeptide (TPR) repeat protein